MTCREMSRHKVSKTYERESRHFKHVGSRPENKEKNKTSKAIRAEEAAITKALKANDPAGCDSYTGTVKRLYRTYVKTHGLCRASSLTGADWTYLFQKKLACDLSHGNCYVKSTTYMNSVYSTISHAVDAIESTYGVSIDRGTVGLYQTRRCPLCGKILTFLPGNKMIGCKTCQTAVRVYPGTNLPAGVLADTRVRAARILLHNNFDPLWRKTDDPSENAHKRREAYFVLASFTNRPIESVHFGQIESLSEASEILSGINQMREEEGLLALDEILPDGTWIRNGQKQDWSDCKVVFEE
jgi:hypothetical protein